MRTTVLTMMALCITAVTANAEPPDAPREGRQPRQIARRGSQR